MHQILTVREISQKMDSQIRVLSIVRKGGGEQAMDGAIIWGLNEIYVAPQPNLGSKIVQSQKSTIPTPKHTVMALLVFLGHKYFLNNFLIFQCNLFLSVWEITGE